MQAKLFTHLPTHLPTYSPTDPPTPPPLPLLPPQAATLLLFNEVEELSYGDVQQRLNLPEEDVSRLLHSLSCAKYKLLNKEPANKVIGKADKFSFNEGFTDRMKRIKVGGGGREGGQEGFWGVRGAERGAGSASRWVLLAGWRRGAGRGIAGCGVRGREMKAVQLLWGMGCGVGGGSNRCCVCGGGGGLSHIGAVWRLYALPPSTHRTPAQCAPTRHN